ncbi:MAG: hypothetical protein LBD87_05520, partial [Prevotellaceae bacterium]|nr:hypothetical protein [Prevotellaceae bacterium]
HEFIRTDSYLMKLMTKKIEKKNLLVKKIVLHLCHIYALLYIGTFVLSLKTANFTTQRIRVNFHAKKRGLLTYDFFRSGCTSEIIRIVRVSVFLRDVQ